MIFQLLAAYKVFILMYNFFSSKTHHYSVEHIMGRTGATQPGAASPPTQAPTVTVSITRAAGATPGNTVAPPATGSQKDDDGGSSGTYIAFGAIAAVLVAGAVFGAVRKARRGR